MFAAALERISAGAASLLFALVPAATALWIRPPAPAGKLPKRASRGVTMSLAGATLVALNSPQEGTAGSGAVLGVGFVVAAVLVTSFHGVYSKRHSGHPLLEVMTPQILIGTMILVALGTLGGALRWEGLSLATWGVVIYLAAGVTVVPAILMWWLFKRTSAMRVALVNYLFPVVAIVVGVLWFGERLSGSLMTGGLVLLVGVGMVESVDGTRHLDRARLRPCPDFAAIPSGAPRG